MTYPITPDSHTDIPYDDYEINRHIGSVNTGYMHLNFGGVIRAAIERARLHGQVSLLDAGCGTGHSLISLKEQIRFRAKIADEAIEAVGISLSDLRSRLNAGCHERNRSRNGYISLRIGNLATMPLEPHRFDVAYSSQVLMHNSEPARIVANILPSLRHNGVYYCDALPEQKAELDTFKTTLDPAEWNMQSTTVTKQCIGGQDTYVFYKFHRFQPVTL
ncbi:MAG TPA: class I SAM-dependent methyltransferase [Candidatus Saccharimonadales bacterium]|nr:class I SAM-dependent methyltransferase [Candidatus Saccharimonadales bacterium]